MRRYTKIVSVHTSNGWIKVEDLSGGFKQVDMYEVKYIDYREDETICGTGTEDMSKERYRALISRGYEIKRANGETTKAGLAKYDFVRVLVIMASKNDFTKLRNMFKTIIYADCKMTSIG